MFGDFQALLLLLGICSAVAALLSLAITKHRPGWSVRRTVLFSALPVPTLVWAFCILVMIDSQLASKEECGVDACGMAFGIAFFVAGMALLGFGAGLLGAWLVRKGARK